MVDQDELKGATAVAFFNRDKINVIVDSRESNEGTPIGDRKANWKAKVHNSAKKWYKISDNIVVVMDLQIFKVYILGSVVRNESIDTSQMYTAFGSGSKYVIDYFNHHKYDRNCSTDQAKDFATKAVFSASFYDKGTNGNLHYFEVNKKQWHEVSYTEALSTYSSYYSEYDEVRILLLVYRDDEGAIAADKLIDMFWPEVDIQTAHVADHRFTPEKNQFYFHRLIFSSEAEVEKALKKTSILGSTYMKI